MLLDSCLICQSKCQIYLTFEGTNFYNRYNIIRHIVLYCIYHLTEASAVKQQSRDKSHKIPQINYCRGVTKILPSMPILGENRHRNGGLADMGISLHCKPCSQFGNILQQFHSTHTSKISTPHTKKISFPPHSYHPTHKNIPQTHITTTLHPNFSPNNPHSVQSFDKLPYQSIFHNHKK